MRIRKATKKDLNSLFLLRYLLAEFESKVDKSEKFNKKTANKEFRDIRRDLGNKNIYYFIALYNEILIGYSKIKIKKINNKVIGHIGADFVLEPFRGIGVGKRLMSVMLKTLKQKKIKKASLEVYRSNRLSVNVHKRLGFKIVGKGSKATLYRMEKKLK
jgi:ribosomal protein S18 acetylase RimI-like enzyme